MEKKPMKSLYRDNPETPEGKYLVKRRDGTVPEWPSFVLGAADPVAESSLLAYCKEVCFLLVCAPEMAAKLGFTPEFARSVHGWVLKFREYRQAHGEGDPGMGRHRQDDPATVAEMQKGRGA
jgi:hypothetical protein